MPLNDKDKTFVRDAIAAAVDHLQPRGWRKALFVLREWSVLGVGATMIVTLLIFALNQFYSANQRIEKEAIFRTKTEDALAKLAEQVNGLQGSLARTQITTQTNLSAGQFRSSLPEIAPTLAALRKQKVVLSESVLDSLAHKVSDAGDDVPGYWPVAAELVSYRSQLLSGWRNLSLPPCSQQGINAPVSEIKQSSDNPRTRTVTMGPVIFRNCALVLDSAEGADLLSKALSFGAVTFDHCIIFFSGGPIAIVPRKVYEDSPPQLKGPLNFNDCIFAFSVSQPPPQSGRKLLEKLLATSGSNIQFLDFANS